MARLVQALFRNAFGDLLATAAERSHLAEFERG